MEVIDWKDVEIHHFNLGHGRGSYRIVHLPTGISVEADSSRCSREPILPLVRKLKDELVKKIIGPIITA